MKLNFSILLKSLGKKLYTSLKRFPEALFFAVATVITLIALNHANYVSHNNYERLAMVFALGVPSCLCMKALIERTGWNLGRRTIFLSGIVGVLILYYIYLLQELNMVTSTRYVATTLALYLLFTVIPFYSKGRHYELYLVNLLTRLFVTYLYGAILFLGLVFTLFTINTLFNFNMSYKVYFDIWLIVVGVFAPAYFLSDIQTYGEDLIKDDYSKILKALLLYIVMPIIIVYTGILYVYFFKIIIQRVWPEGLVSHLVLWYSIVSTIVIIFIYPLKESNKWVSTFVTYFPKTIIPILIMMFISMGIRINAYGITENRYFVLVAGLWIAVSMIYLSLKKNVKNIYIAMALIIISIISVYGPLSSYSISKYSQNNRLERIFNKYNIIQNGSINNPSTEVTEEDKQDINSIIIYFNRNHKLGDIRYIPNNYEIKDIEEILGFQITYYWGTPYEQREYFRYSATEHGRFINVSEYDYFVEFPLYRFVNISHDDEQMSISYNNEDRKVKITRGNVEIYNKKVDDIVDNLVKASGDKYELESDVMTIEDIEDDIKVVYLINHISGYRDTKDESILLDYIDFKLVIKVN